MMQTVRLERGPAVTKLLRISNELQVQRGAPTVQVIATGTGVPGPQGPEGPQGPPISVAFGPTPPADPTEGDLWIQTT